MECPSFGVCSKAESCWDESGDTARCWNIVWVLLSLGILLIAYGDVSLTKPGLLAVLFGRMREESEEEILKRDQERTREAFLQGHGARSLANFCKDITDKSVATPCGDEAHPLYKPIPFPPSDYLFTVSSIWTSFCHLVYSQYMQSIGFGSLGWGCVCSGVATILWLILAWEDLCVQEGYRAVDNMPNTRYIEQTGAALNLVLRTFVFLPTFFLLTAVRRASVEWLSWLNAVKKSRHAYRDAAAILGSRYDPPKDCLQAGRQELYKVYRYANLVHLNSLKKYASPDIANLSMNDDKCLDSDYVDKLGLLTPEEALQLKAVKTSARPWLIVSWLSRAMTDFCNSEACVGQGDLSAGDPSALMQTILNRINPSATSATRITPNILLRTMFLLGWLFVLLIVVGFPFSLLVYAGYNQSIILLGTPCFQPVVLFGVALFVGSIRLTLMALFVLRGPFSYENENIHVDFVLASTDQELFTLLRAQFHSPPASSNEQGT